MNRFRQICTALVLTITIAFSASAGEMHGGRTGEMDGGKTPEIQTVTAGQGAAQATKITLNLLFGMLSLI